MFHLWLILSLSLRFRPETDKIIIPSRRAGEKGRKRAR